MFEAELVFTTWEDAKGAEDELRGAGFQTEITDDVDDDFGAVFMVFSCLCELDPMKRSKPSSTRSMASARNGSLQHEFPGF